jgi:N-acetylmuramoyl-L-alanine amidase
MKRGGLNSDTKIRLICILALAALAVVCAAFSVRAQGSSRAAAEAQYAKAEKVRQALEALPEDKRTFEEYKKVAAAYRKVYLLSSSAGATTPALMEVGALYRYMGDHFDKSYYQNALVTYQFLLSQYPGSKFRSDALFAVAEIEKDNLGEIPEAKDSFTEYLRRFPRAANVQDVREALEELASEQPNAVAVSASDKSQSPDESSKETEAAASGTITSGGTAVVTDIRTWNADDYTRVVVDLDGSVQYQAARIKNPDRIYFDLYKAQLGHSITEKELPIQNGFLKSVRVAQNKSGVVRLVLDVQSIKGYSAFLLPNPYRLVIDIHGTDLLASDKKPAPGLGPGKLAGDSRATAEDAGAASDAADAPDPTTSLASAASPDSRASRGERIPTGVPAVAAKPTHDGERSLTRALGLKISRIVIDPGHGGYDTGTIGPDGTMEKNICLDVALRLGKLIQKKLPGAQVIYTRKTDVFVPLEERTAIANQAKADLFISIHANSSHDHAARGVETYYLNFTTSPEALEVASRENALSDSSIHELQDLIKKIARNDKIEESRELATDIQDSLTHQLRLISTAEKDRGVKKAPFVVLIGADMPSVLAEIAFLSNRTDEHMLERASQREKIAQGIFRGIEEYLSSLNSLNYDRKRLVSDQQPVAGISDKNQ